MTVVFEVTQSGQGPQEHGCARLRISKSLDDFSDGRGSLALGEELEDVEHSSGGFDQTCFTASWGRLRRSAGRGTRLPVSDRVLARKRSRIEPDDLVHRHLQVDAVPLRR